MDKIDELRKRLDALGRARRADAEREDLRRGLRKRRSGAGEATEARPAEGRRPPVGPIVFQRDLPRREPPRPQALGPAGPFVSLDDALAESGALAADGSGVVIVDRRADGDEGLSLAEALRAAVASRDSGLWRQLGHIGFEAALRPEDLVLFDLETTGLTSTPLFLIGAMVFDGGALVSRQLFARDYSKEAAVVERFIAMAGGRKLLVSFNGRSFDLPYVATRAAANGLACRFEQPHLDLLHAARRVWGPRAGRGAAGVPDCRLQTLERHICGRLRAGDIPGHLIPEAYHEFVRTGNACRMVSVLEHNYLDLLTMADLIARLPPPEP